MPWNSTTKEPGKEISKAIFKAISKGEVFVIDDDAATREALSSTLQKHGYEVISFTDGAALLSYAKTRTPVCVFLEVGVSNRSGFDVLKKLRAENCPAPIFVTSEDGLIPIAVEAIRNGAFDFIVKPIRASEVVVRMDAALDEFAQAAMKGNFSKIPLSVPGCEPLTGRERDVLARLAMGETNKEIARHLGLSARTIEGYRAEIMRKVGARTAAELLRRLFGQSRRQNRHP